MASAISPSGSGAARGASAAALVGRWISRVAPHEWLLLTVMVALSDRYFWFMDDAFIYFRYVDNLVLLGRGLVYNTGEYVEAFTSPLWTLLLAGLRPLGVDYWRMLRGATWLFALLLWAMAVEVNRRLSPDPDARAGAAGTVNLPAALAAGHYGITTHLSSGLETPLVQLAAGVFALAILKPHSRALHVLVALSPLARPELALAAAVYGLWWIATQRRLPVLLLLAGLAFNGGWLAFRIYYYADLFPNTYYIKGDASWAQGLRYLDNTFAAHLLWPLFGALLLLLLWQRRALGRTLGARAAMLACALPVALAAIRVGGDMLYFRYLAFPALLMLLACGGIAEAALRRALRDAPRPALLVAGASLAALVLAFSVSRYPEQLKSHPLGADVETELVDQISDAAWHRAHGQLRYSEQNLQYDRDMRSAYRAATKEQLAQHEAMVHPWCRRAFTEFDKHMINSYGLTDGVLSRLAVKPFRPGHKKLAGYAKDVARVHGTTGFARRPGVFREAAEAGKAARWIVAQLDQLEQLERRIYNRHDFAENLQLALAPRIRLSPRGKVR